MIMKKFNIYIIFLSAILILASCSDWLDVQPSTEKDRADLVESADGYKKMLYGTYINLTSPTLYGGNLTYGLLASLGRDYVKDLSYVSWVHYNYGDDFRSSYFDPIWSTMYNNIANVNSILADIDEHKASFRQGEYELVAGEAYAERAFMHFDLLRMFAPNYVGNEDAIAIPYITSYEAARHVHQTAREVMKRVMEDLDQAENLLKAGNDPLINSLQEITYKGGDTFTANRQYHSNYWAVEALKARVYLYMGDKANALKYAQAVISNAPFTWTPESVISSGDKVFQSEMIFGLDVPELPNYYEANFTSENFVLAEMGWSSYNVYSLNIFEDANDYRYLYLLTNDKNGNLQALPSKLKQDVGSSKTMKKQTIPLIRLGEMYLIAAECQAESNPAEAIQLLRTLKKNRGYFASDAGVAEGSDANAINDYVRREMRKETYSEGQFWFYLKRTDSASVPNFSAWSPTTPVQLSVYTFAIPEMEKEYGAIPSTDKKEDGKAN